MRSRHTINRAVFALALVVPVVGMVLAPSRMGLAVERPVDDVSLIIHKVPKLEIADQGVNVTLNGDLSLTLINSGNRPVRVAGIELSIGQSHDRGCPGFMIESGFEPFTLAPDDTVPLRTAIESGNLKVNLKFAGHHGLCLVFRLATPSSADIVQAVELVAIDVRKGQTSANPVAAGRATLFKRGTRSRSGSDD